MNHIYRVVWNNVTVCWQVVSESAVAHGKTRSARSKPMWRLLAVALAIASFAAPAAWAGPTGGQVTAGSAAIQQTGATTTINQSSQNVAINWQSFSVGKTEAVRFNQPNPSAVALNRVTGTESSQVLGSLTANGRVFILNPNGVLFGKDAQVNVGSIVASTGRMSDADFMSGNYRITGATAGSIANEGNVNVAEGGVLAFIAPSVTNTGNINGPKGSVLLVGAEAVTIKVQDGSLVGYTIDKGGLDTLVANGGVIRAEGGHVVLTAKGLDSLSRASVNHSGIIEAQTVSNKNGVVELLGDMSVGTVNLSGRIDASAPNGGDGGYVETSAAKVKVADGAVVDTRASRGSAGTWLIDPTDMTISEGSAPVSGSGIGSDTLSSNLAFGNVVIDTDTPGTDPGDINVDGVVTWDANRLTLHASRNININADLIGTGTAQLAFEYGQAAASFGNTADYHLNNGASVTLPAGTNFFTKLGSDGALSAFTVITQLGDEGDTSTTTLQGMKNNVTGNYVLGADIDASVTVDWNVGAGWEPIGSSASLPFTGVLAGLGHTISNLVIYRPDTRGVGFFGFVRGSVREVGLLGGSMTGKELVGSLAGENLHGGSLISRSYATSYVAGLGELTYAGGLVGWNGGGSVIERSHASGAVETSHNNSWVGGLVGGNNADIRDCYATGGVVGQDVAGGLVGASNGVITRSYSTGGAFGRNSAGGLVGRMDGGSSITNSYSHGDVGGFNNLGGLVGWRLGGVVENSYSTGAVLAGTVAGGLIGRDDVGASGTMNSYWDVETSGRLTSAGSETGLPTIQMKQQASYGGWDFTNTWRIVEGSSYPLLRSLTQGTLVVSAIARDAAKAYDQIPWTGGVIDYSGFIGGDTASSLTGSIRWIGTAEGAVNVGTYSLVPTGLSSQKYEIQFSPGTLSIVPRVLDVQVTKTYDANATFTEGFALVGGRVLPGDSVAISGSATVASANAGTYSAFVSNNLVSSNPNYTANPVNTAAYTYGSMGNVTATISPALVTLVGLTGAREYDGTRNAYATDVVALNGVLPADRGQVTVASGIGELAGKDVGAQPLVSSGSLALGGTAAGNYTLDAGSSSWTIVPRALDVQVTKTYNASPTFTEGFAAVGDRVLPGDTVSISGNATVASPNAGTYTSFVSNNLVSSNPNYTANPINTAIYTYGSGSNVSATISPALLTLVGLTGAREYDGTPNAYASDVVAIRGIQDPDDQARVSIVGVGELSGRDVGVQTLVAAGSLALAGGGAANYAIDAGTSTWTIVPRALDVQVTKIYNATPTFTEGFTLVGNRVLPGDAVSISGSATVASANAGTYTSFVSNNLVSSNPNYTYGSGSNVSATILPGTLLPPPVPDDRDGGAKGVGLVVPASTYSTAGLIAELTASRSQIEVDPCQGALDCIRALKNAVVDHVEEFRDQKNVSLPPTVHAMFEGMRAGNSDWVLINDPTETVYHQDGIGRAELKFVNQKDGREAVYDGDTNQLVLDQQIKGTYNLANPDNKFGHIVFDIALSPQVWNYYETHGWGLLLVHARDKLPPKGRVLLSDLIAAADSLGDQRTALITNVNDLVGSANKVTLDSTVGKVVTTTIDVTKSGVSAAKSTSQLMSKLADPLTAFEKLDKADKILGKVGGALQIAGSAVVLSNILADAAQGTLSLGNGLDAAVNIVGYTPAKLLTAPFELAALAASISDGQGLSEALSSDLEVAKTGVSSFLNDMELLAINLAKGALTNEQAEKKFGERREYYSSAMLDLRSSYRDWVLSGTLLMTGHSADRDKVMRAIDTTMSQINAFTLSQVQVTAAAKVLVGG